VENLQVKPKRLGRGLRGLINRSDEPAAPPSRTAPPPIPAAAKPVPGVAPATAPAAPVAGARDLAVDLIEPNPYQPRRAFGEDDLAGLKASIKEHGLLQPIVVRRGPAGFELIAGERRLRAVKALGLERVPAVIREADDQDMQTLALVENLQRVDLNAMEKARALQAMMRNFGFTQQEVADRVGKARTSISNLVRLLDLQAEIQDLVSDGSLSGAQARALLLVKGPEARLALAMRAVREGLTVRRIEQLAAEKRKPRSGTSSAPDPYLADLEERLRRALGTTVALKASGGGGRIEIRYHDAGELDRLLELFGAA
jgi:ParB family chromosome partitioning protein